MAKKERELKNFEDEYMVKIQSGKYVPSFTNELKEVQELIVVKVLLSSVEVKL